MTPDCFLKVFKVVLSAIIQFTRYGNLLLRPLLISTFVSKLPSRLPLLLLPPLLLRSTAATNAHHSDTFNVDVRVLGKDHVVEVHSSYTQFNSTPSNLFLFAVAVHQIEMAA